MTPCGTSPASIWPSDLPRSFRSCDTIPLLVPSSPIVPCPTAAPHATPPLHCCSIHSDLPSLLTFFLHSVTLVHHVTRALHIFSDLGLISIISAILYISLHQQVDPYPFLFGSPARCASCLVYFLHNKLNTLDPLLVLRSAPLCLPTFRPDHSCPYRMGMQRMMAATLGFANPSTCVLDLANVRVEGMCKGNPLLDVPRSASRPASRPAPRYVLSHLPSAPLALDLTRRPLTSHNSLWNPSHSA